jgi:hypothetical protein
MAGCRSSQWDAARALGRLLSKEPARFSQALSRATQGSKDARAAKEPSPEAPEGYEKMLMQATIDDAPKRSASPFPTLERGTPMCYGLRRGRVLSQMKVHPRWIEMEFEGQSVSIDIAKLMPISAAEKEAKTVSLLPEAPPPRSDAEADKVDLMQHLDDGRKIDDLSREEVQFYRKEEIAAGAERPFRARMVNGACWSLLIGISALEPSDQPSRLWSCNSSRTASSSRSSTEPLQKTPFSRRTSSAPQRKSPPCGARCEG